MKRLFLLVVAVLFVAAGYAQSVKFTVPDVDVKLKRCIGSGNSAYIDLVMTNWTNKEIQAHCTDRDHLNNYGVIYTAAYDDEGNVYKFKSALSVTVSGEDVAFGSFYLPREVPVKVRVYIKNLSEYAREFKLLKMSFRGVSPVEPYGISLLEVRGIPITRQ